MSGDVQPRKRKDKKRKKDDNTEQILSQPHVSSSTGIQNEDLNIHVHKDDGTGGGFCAKIIFFLLFSALTVLIGLIMIEHRGLTDLDTVDTESRFSLLFEGWVDNSVGNDEHDDVDHIESSLEDHEHENKIADSHESGENEEDEPDEEDEGLEDEVEQTEEDEEEDEEEEEDVEESDLASEEVPQTEEEDEETAEDDENASEVQSTNEDEEEEEEVDVSEDDEQATEQSVEEEQNDDDYGNDEDDNEEEENQSDEKGTESKEEEEEEQNISAESGGKGSEELENEEEQSSKQVEDETATEIDQDGEEQGDQEEQNSKMVIKIGVGVALLVVAHVVLVRKWKSAILPNGASETEAVPDLSRRNTIVVPPEYQEVEKDIEEAEEYSDEDGEVESDEERMAELKSAKVKYQELRTTYSRSLTPESEPEYQPKLTDPDEDEEEYEEEDDEEEVEDEEEEEDEDEELLKRLEARYGKLRREADKEGEDNQFSSWKRVDVRENEESDADKQSDDDTDYENITNKDDLESKEQIDKAHREIQNNTAYAIKLFDVLLKKHPSSPRSLYGKAQALEKLADQRRSNEILQKAINIYLQILDLDNIPNALFEAAAERSIDRLRFLGHYNRAIDVHYKIISRFPTEPKYKNQLVVSLLTINRINKARLILQDILSNHPTDGFALVHYGFILKTVDNKLDESVSYLQKGISTKAPEVIDGRFYFHLGDALTRLGRNEEAMKIYQEGVEHNLFLSKYQRSLYNVDRLKGQPWWKKEETPYADLYTALESNWKKIREEGISVLNKNGLFQNESENLKNRGDWKQLELFARGQKNINNCKKCPVTCRIIESVPDAKGCRRGQTKFSVMHPGTHVWPHCGPTNCRLRVHLGLKVPPQTYIRVADETRSWKEGKVFIFDDSFEHEVWHNGSSFRLVLIVDVWHPELTQLEKKTLSPI